MIGYDQHVANIDDDGVGAGTLFCRGRCGLYPIPHDRCASGADAHVAITSMPALSVGRALHSCGDHALTLTISPH